MIGSVFIVDDNPNNLSLLTGILRDAGYEVRMARSGPRALAAIRARPPELVMLDVDMPEMNGYEVCQALKADPATEQIPVVFLSALDDPSDKVTAFAAGGVDYVTKPFHSDEVLARVASQLRLSRLRLELAEKNARLVAQNDALERAWRSNDRAFATLAEVLPGVVLDGRYRLEEKIGVGGFAAIYRGRHLRLDRPVAVKVLRLDPGDEAARALERFRREGVSATRVNHPNAVQVLDTGITAERIPYLVMELLEGDSLHTALERDGPMSLARAGAIVGVVSDVLARAHASGVVHRDIKPSNIFLHRPAAGEGRPAEVVKVVDFGIATFFDDQHLDSALTTSGRIVGTPVYMPPERLMGRSYDGRADVYSVAVTLYEMVTGRLPLEPAGSLGAMIMSCVTEAPVPLRRIVRDIPLDIDALVASALAKDPQQRPSAEAFREALARALAEAPDAVLHARMPAPDPGPKHAAALPTTAPHPGESL